MPPVIQTTESTNVKDSTVPDTTPVADGTYTVGNRITPTTGDLGTITVVGGVIIAVQEAT